MEIIITLLPNSKCLTKIKNHLQLGLIRELIGLLPVGKQWGEATLNAAKTLPISFAEVAYCAVGTPRGAANTDNTTCYKIDVNSVYFSNYGYNGKCYFIVVGL